MRWRKYWISKTYKKKFKLNANPKIINFVHTPPNLWSIYEAKFNNYISDKIIILNYPEKIHVDLVSMGIMYLNLKIHYFSTISKNIKNLIKKLILKLII